MFKSIGHKIFKLGALSGTLFVAACHHEELGTADLEKALNAFDYIKLKLPSTTYQPGDLVFRANYSPEIARPASTSLGHLCSPKYSTDKYGEEPVESASESRQIFRRLGGEFSVSPGVLAEVLNFDLGATVSAAKELHLSLSNVQIHSYALDDLARIRRELGPDCTKFVQDNIATQNAYQVERTLTATVKVEAVIDAGVDASIQAKALAELAELGIAVNTANKATIEGEALVYGIRWVPLF